MTRAARSLFLFGIFIVVVGAVLIAIPGTLMSLLRLPPATAGWARVVGLLAVVIGAYDATAGRAECLPYLRASIPIRFGFALGTILLVAAGEMPPTLLLFGATDAAGAIWTMFALRS